MRTHLIALFAVVMANLSGGAAMAESKSETEAQNKATIEASLDAWKNGKGSPFDLLADDATWTIVGQSVVSKTYGSREAFMREVIRPFNARMRQGLRPTLVRGLHADGDTVVAFFDAAGVARDGKPYTNTYAWFMQLRGGKVVKASAFFDSVTFDEFWRRVTPAEESTPQRAEK
jgi:uncharacterized protein